MKKEILLIVGLFGLEPHLASSKLRLLFGSHQASTITALSPCRFLAAACLRVCAECGEAVAENSAVTVAAGHAAPHCGAAIEGRQPNMPTFQKPS